MRTINGINSNFLDAGLQFPSRVLIESSTKYFKNRTYQPDSKGLLPTRVEISKFYKDSHPENILITASTSESYLNIFNILPQNSKILFPKPTYPLFEYVAKYANIEYEFYDLEVDYWNINFKNLESKLAIDNNISAIVIISPNNPTGSVIGEFEFRKLQNLAIKYNLKLIIDTVFDTFDYKKTTLLTSLPITTKIEIFWLNGISKMFALPDLKLAWIYYQNPEISILDKMETFNDTFLNANYLSQSIFSEIAENGVEFQNSMRNQLESNLHICNDIDKNIYQYSLPEGGIHFVLSYNKERFNSDLEFSEFLENEVSILSHPLSYYEYFSSKPSVVLSILQKQEDMIEIVGRLNALEI